MTESFEKNAPSRGRDNTCPESRRPVSTTCRPARQTKREYDPSVDAANDGYVVNTNGLRTPAPVWKNPYVPPKEKNK